MASFIPLSVPNIKGNEIKYVTDALEKEWVSTGGAYITEFEHKIAKYLKVEQAVACQSGTAGLHLAMRLSNVSPDDMVIVPTLTFIAAVNPVKYMGATPVFMDCDDSLCMDMNKLQAFCENECEMTNEGLIHKETQKRVKAVVVVHVFGNMADMEKAVDLSEKYHLSLIEDATEALGTCYTEGRYKGKYAGTIGDYGVLSFNGNKIMTTGGGGMMLFKETKQAERAKYLSTQAKDDTVYFIHDDIGYNYRMTNLQAAVGVAQLEKLDTFILAKKNHYMRYQQGFKNTDSVRLLPFRKGTRPNYWFYSLYLEDLNRVALRDLIDKLNQENIQTRPVWGLIHEQKPYQNDPAFSIEKALVYHQHIVNIPCSTNLTVDEVDRVIETIKKVMN